MLDVCVSVDISTKERHTTTFPTQIFCKILSYLASSYAVMPASLHNSTSSLTTDVFLGPIFQVCRAWRAHPGVNDEFWECCCYHRAPYARIHDKVYSAATLHAMFGFRRWHLLLAEGMTYWSQYHSHDSTLFVRFKPIRDKNTKIVLLSDDIVHTQGISFVASKKQKHKFRFHNFVVGISTETNAHYVFNNGIVFSLSAEYPISRKFHLTIDTESKMFAIVDETFDVIRCVAYDRLVRGAAALPIRFFCCTTNECHFKLSSYLHPHALSRP